MMSDQSRKRPAGSSPDEQPESKTSRTGDQDVSNLLTNAAPTVQQGESSTIGDFDKDILVQIGGWGISQETLLEDYHIVLIVTTVLTASGLDMSLADAHRVLKNKQQYKEEVRQCLRSGKFQQIATWPEWNVQKSQEIRQIKLKVESPEQASEKGATTRSWNIDYKGSAASCLFQTITKYITSDVITHKTGERRISDYYARFLSIVQSSGTGKSRMIDELSKRHIVIPVNLRTTGTTGYPPPDKEARDFLLQSKDHPERYDAYFTALFKTAHAKIQKIKIDLGLPDDRDLGDDEIELLAISFRNDMIEKQEYNEYGEKRRSFYHDVVNTANKYFPITEKIEAAKEKLAMTIGSPPSFEFGASNDILNAAKDLTELIDPQHSGRQPLIILSFDEAHPFMIEQASDGSSLFVHLRHSLRRFSATRIFTLFLSTMSKISAFTPPQPKDPSGRVSRGELKIFPLFTQLGFDQLVDKLEEGTKTIEDVSKDEYMVKFGRPLFGARYHCGNEEVRNNIVLFAYEKLRTHCRDDSDDDDIDLACLSVRIPLQFKTATTARFEQEQRLVADHMRICLHIDQKFESMITIAPSEPILAEGARRHMSAVGYNLPEKMCEHLERSGLDKGNRGELIALVILVLACDRASKETGRRAYGLLEFMSSLFPSDKYQHICESKPTKYKDENDLKLDFKTTFLKSHIYFNHFLKVHDYEVINRKFLWKLIARGAAVLCANNQRGVDIIIPFTYIDTRLKHENVSAFFIQVKNDNTFGDKPKHFLFDGMNPFKIHFFDKKDTAIPVIRMVFALASTEPAVKVGYPAERQSSRTKKTKNYTAFDIWCAGASSKTFSVIAEKDEPTYQQLLQISKDFPVAYESDSGVGEAVRLQMVMNPSSASDPRHWVL